MDVSQQCQALGQTLLILAGDPAAQWASLAEQLQIDTIFCETIAAPKEMAQVATLRQQGYQLMSFWQSSQLTPEQLPFDCAQLPLAFTHTLDRLLSKQGSPQLRHYRPHQLASMFSLR